MNGELLYTLTLFTTFLCLGFSLWFAIYLLSRSHNNHLAFRATIALVALAFYYNSALNDLTITASDSSQIRSFAIIVALIACNDLTYYLLNSQQRKKLYPVARGVVLFALVSILLIFTSPPAQFCPPEQVCPSKLIYPYLVIDFYKIFLFGSILYNLWLIKQTQGRLKNIAFYLAVLVGSGSVAYGLIGTLLNQPVPRLLPNLLIFSALVLLAISVTRDRTFVTQRMATYDLPIKLLTFCFIVVVYLLAGRQLKLPADQILLIAVLAIFTHSAYDFVRDFLDRLLHREERRIRQQLQTLGRGVSEEDSLKRYLNRGLAMLCYNLHASCGFIAAREDDHYVIVASLHSLPVGSPFPSKHFTLERAAEPASSIFQNIAWLAPAYVGRDQAAVVGLGLRKDKVPYCEEDIYWLEDIADEMGTIIHLNAQRRVNSIQSPQLEQNNTSGSNVSQPIDPGSLLSAFAYHPDLELVKIIDDGYRNLNDYDELGKSPLVSLFGIQGEDHFERGKLVHNRLVESLERLKPSGQLPKEPIPSEWYAYTILYDSYVQERLSREIMARLFIGEGTYYRLRRQAIRGITRSLLETGVMTQTP